MSKKLTLEEVKNKLFMINGNIEIISTEYINAKTHLKCKCLLDGYEWYSAWVNLGKGKGCPKCARVLKQAENSRDFSHVMNRQHT